MSLFTPERLYRLLPAVYRVRDAEQGQPLRALLAVVEGELGRVEADTAALYDNWFVETCDEWVVPYIGDLLGARSIRPVPSARVSARAYVANTIAYRRRKGTATVLEQLARDTSGWPARAVEFFERLATTQHLNHVRPVPTATAGVRDAARAELASAAAGAFDPYAHTLEVRNAATRGGRFNIPVVDIFLWRLQSYAVGSGEPGDPAADFVSARRQPGWWTVHPAGIDSPLFNRPRTETAITHLAEEDNVPGPLRRLALNAELERLRAGTALPAPRFMTANDPVLRVWVQVLDESAPVQVRRDDMYLCEIPDAVEFALPTPRALAFDPARGRLAFPAALPVQAVWTQVSYGFSGDIGGGPYDRGASIRALNRSLAVDISPATDATGVFDPGVWQVGVSHLIADDGRGLLFATLAEAVGAWNSQPPGRTGVIVLMDSLTDGPEGDGQSIEIVVGEKSTLLIVAGLWPVEPIPGAPGASARRAGHFEARQIRVHHRGDLVVRGSAPAASADPGSCIVNGLLLEGSVVVAPGRLGQLVLAHTTVIPGVGMLTVEASGNETLKIAIDHAICGAVTIAAPIDKLQIADSLIAAGTGSPEIAVDAAACAADLQRSTFFGAVLALTLSASDCIFDAPVYAERRQTGCVRFCHVPPGSTVPRRYRCQPELEASTRIAALRAAMPAGSAPTPAAEAAVRAEVQALVRPLFVSRRYGDPGYGQIDLRCAAQIRTGAESGAEMGAFEFLQQPQREANLRDALAEYLRFGLEAGVFFVT